MEPFFLLLLLIVLSGMFSGSETALVTLSIGRADALRKAGRPGAQALYYLKENPSRMLTTILIGNNIVNIAATALATVLATKLFGEVGPGIAVGVLTLLILIFGEITPKSLAIRYAERISLFIAPPMYAFMRLIYPLVWFFDKLTTWIHTGTAISGDPIVTESELISMIEHGEEEGVIESDERQLIERVFTFGDLVAGDVMTPRKDVFCLDQNLTLAEVLSSIVHVPYNRIPLYENSREDICYVLYLRDVLEAVADGLTNVRLYEIAHDPDYVPETQPVDELIALLRKRRRHMAVVVDEHGTVQGIVTLEDLLEELVGEIYDESDEKPNQYSELPNEEILIEGSAELRVVEAIFDVDIPGKPTDTVSKWLLDHTERIPEPNEKFRFDGFEVRVQAASRRRVHQVVLRLLSPSEMTPL